MYLIIFTVFTRNLVTFIEEYFTMCELSLPPLYNVPTCNNRTIIDSQNAYYIFISHHNSPLKYRNNLLNQVKFPNRALLPSQTASHTISPFCLLFVPFLEQHLLLSGASAIIISVSLVPDTAYSTNKNGPSLLLSDTRQFFDVKYNCVPLLSRKVSSANNCVSVLSDIASNCSSAQKENLLSQGRVGPLDLPQTDKLTLIIIIHVICTPYRQASTTNMTMCYLSLLLLVFQVRVRRRLWKS